MHLPLKVFIMVSLQPHLFKISSIPITTRTQNYEMMQLEQNNHNTQQVSRDRRRDDGVTHGLLRRNNGS